MQQIKCNICGGESRKFLFYGHDRLLRVDDAVFNVEQCRNCGLVFLNPQPTAVELQKYYPSNYGPYQNIDEMMKYGYLSKVTKSFFSLFEKKAPEATRLEDPVDATIMNYLDFGCGGGAQLEHTKQEHPNWNFYGLDNNEYACQKVKEKGFNIFCGDFDNIELPNDFFDVINMSHVIEHLNDPKMVVGRLSKSLKSDGIIRITTPNFDSWGAKIFGSYWYAAEVPRHLFLFSPHTLDRLLGDLNLRIEKIVFHSGPKVEIRSFYYLIGRKDLRINPFFWRLINPLAVAASCFGKASIITVYARKNEK